MRAVDHCDARELRVFLESRSDFAEQLPDRFHARRRAIAALPLVEWKGRPLRQLRCWGGHLYNVAESLPWQLIDLGHFCCPWHINASIQEPHPIQQDLPLGAT